MHITMSAFWGLLNRLSNPYRKACQDSYLESGIQVNGPQNTFIWTVIKYMPINRHISLLMFWGPFIRLSNPYRKACQETYIF